MRAILLLLLVQVAAAQPSGSDVVERWRTEWRSAASRASFVSMNESTERSFIGPRRETTIEIDGRVEYDFEGPPQRSVRRLVIDGDEVSAERERRHRGRLGRAFGPAGREVSAPPPLAVALLDRARVRSIEADRVGSVRAWRVDLEVDARRETDRGQAWFAQSDGRLLRLRVEGERPRGGRIERDARYTRVAGLDLPTSYTAEFTVRQRRRLRQYVVTLTSETTFRGHTVR